MVLLSNLYRSSQFQDLSDYIGIFSCYRHIEKHLGVSKSEQLFKDDIEAIREGDEARGKVLI